MHTNQFHTEIAIKDLKEKELAANLETLLSGIGLELIQSEAKLGKFRFDAIAKNLNSENEYIIIELKVNMAPTAMGQLLIYPHILRNHLKLNDKSNLKIRSVLITTYLDINLVEITNEFNKKLNTNIDLYICIKDEQNCFTLVKPEDQRAGGQFRIHKPIPIEKQPNWLEKIY